MKGRVIRIADEVISNPLGACACLVLLGIGGSLIKCGIDQLMHRPARSEWSSAEAQGNDDKAADLRKKMEGDVRHSLDDYLYRTRSGQQDPPPVNLADGGLSQFDDATSINERLDDLKVAVNIQPTTIAVALDWPIMAEADGIRNPTAIAERAREISELDMEYKLTAWFEAVFGALKQDFALDTVGKELALTAKFHIYWDDPSGANPPHGHASRVLEKYPHSARLRFADVVQIDWRSIDTHRLWGMLFSH